MSTESFFEDVRETLLRFSLQTRGTNPSDAVESVEIDIPSAFLDTRGHPRFTMELPISLVVSDLGAAQLFYHEVAGRGYEFALRCFLDFHLLSDDVFIDVGAHWGIHSLTAATRWPRQVSVLAMEAHPENSARLRQWVERNHLGGDVEVISKAIGNRVGVARMWVSGSSMGHNLRVDRSESGAKTIDAPITTLDQLLTERPHLRWRRVFLKLDVEGCELEVLQGAQQLFSRGDVVAVLWEKASFHEEIVQDARNTAVFDFLNSHGFAHFYMEDGDLGGRLLPLERQDIQCNLFSLAPNFERRMRYA
jgi:FkbM family methyltransferase